MRDFVRSVPNTVWDGSWIKSLAPQTPAASLASPTVVLPSTPPLSRGAHPCRRDVMPQGSTHRSPQLSLTNPERLTNRCTCSLPNIAIRTHQSAAELVTNSGRPRTRMALWTSRWQAKQSCKQPSAVSLTSPARTPSAHVWARARKSEGGTIECFTQASSKPIVRVVVPNVPRKSRSEDARGRPSMKHGGWQ